MTKLTVKKFAIATALVLIPGSGVVAGIYMVYRYFKKRKNNKELQ